MKILADYWFSDMGGGTVGIVCAEDELTGERKAYIGKVDGFDQEGDRRHVLECGAKLPLSFLEGLVGLLKPKKKGKGKP